MSALGQEQATELARITFGVIAPAAWQSIFTAIRLALSLVSNFAADLPLPCKESSLPRDVLLPTEKFTFLVVLGSVDLAAGKTPIENA